MSAARLTDEQLAELRRLAAADRLGLIAAGALRGLEWLPSILATIDELTKERDRARAKRTQDDDRPLRICARCGHPERPHRFRHPFTPSSAPDRGDTDQVPHVVTRAGDPKVLPMECLHCGATLTLQLPVSIDSMAAVCDAFVGRHKHCPKPAGGEP